MKSVPALLVVALFAMAGGPLESSWAQGPGLPRVKQFGVKGAAPLADRTKADKAGSIIKQPENLDKAKKVATGLRIARFDAARDSRDIDLTGAIENVSLQPIAGVSYSIYKRTASGWQKIKSGANMSVNARRTIYISGLDAPTNAMVVYKLDIANPGQQDTREFVLQARNLSYVVRFDTKGNWLTARYYPPSVPTGVDRRGAPAKGSEVLAGAVPRQLMTSLQGLGFASKVTTKRYEHAFSDWEFEFWVYARTTAPVTRTFDTWQAAVAFRDQLRTHVADKNLLVEILEK